MPNLQLISNLIKIFMRNAGPNNCAPGHGALEAAAKNKRHYEKINMQNLRSKTAARLAMSDHQITFIYVSSFGNGRTATPAENEPIRKKRGRRTAYERHFLFVTLATIVFATMIVFKVRDLTSYVQWLSVYYKKLVQSLVVNTAKGLPLALPKF